MATILALRRFLRMGDGSNISTATMENRNRVLTGFILTLSDQQLVTGLAILITGYSQRCEISGYHFVIIANLAWFSSTTHLSTLAILRYYLINHPVLKVWRMIGMICLLGMLFHAQLYTQWYTIFSLPIQCTFTVGLPYLSSAAEDGRYTFFNASIWSTILIFLIFTYGNNFIRLLAAPPSTSVLTLVDVSIRKACGLRSSGSVPTTLTNNNTTPSGHNAVAGNPRRPNRLRGFAADIKKTFFSTYALWNLFTESFMWEIEWMIFGNVFGITQVYVARWGWNPDAGDVNIGLTYSVIGSETEMTFGQLVAILLLALPLISAAESYYGKRPMSDQESMFND
ncbi:hypothetical protein FOPE_06436 [Fonsecaea pedrosoi]|nr:hypothetical protein FOPE_06436 [Fonsecaea pedrosoi]